jgi:ABC-type branched-subunit amino acid transport system ATPase component
MSVSDNVSLSGGGKNANSERKLPGFGAEDRQILHIVGLSGLAGEKAGNLSYGQQKLLTFACCLAGRATVLLLDEPVAGVDPAMREEIVRILREIGGMGRLVVFIEHDIETVRRVAEAVVVMDEGKIIAFGSPKEVLSRPDIMESYLG